MRPTRLPLLGASLLLALAAGCAPRHSANAPRGASVPAPPPSHPGLTYVFPGIEGHPIWYLEVRRAYRDAGLKGDFRLFDWGRPLNNLANLTELAENRRKAALVADELAAWRRSHPHAPLRLAGYSAGGGMALLVLEQLAPTVQVDSVALVQPAISPEFDLSPALARVRGTLTNFYVPTDGLILGWGTRTFGTVDRAYCDSAGKVGFAVEKTLADKQLQHKVRQERWSRAWFRAGHWGTHIAMLGYTWNRNIVAPALLREQTPEFPAATRDSVEIRAAALPQ